VKAEYFLDELLSGTEPREDVFIGDPLNF
jgi:hypothetical protein